MFKLIFSFYLIIHILGDFYFQSDKLSEKKIRGYKYVALHSLFYFFVAFACIIPVWSVPQLISVSTLSFLHFLVDSVKFFYLKSKNNEQNSLIYIVDQLIHIGFIIIVASAFIYAGYDTYLLPPIRDYLSSITEHPEAILRWVGLALMTFKPANITIKQLVAKYKPKENNSDNLNNTGAFIGTLERIIILLLLSVGQYSAIGLVLTAKSIARYNKISEEKQFAEYYLLGTLLSALYAIGTYFLFM